MRITNWKIVLLLFFIFALLFFIPESTYAQIVINEFDTFANPQAVELYNNSSQTIDINSWYLDDSGGTTYLTIANQPPLQPQTCVVIRGSLNLNTSSPDTARLFDATAPPTSAAGHLIDSYAYTQSAPAGTNYSRSPDGEGVFTLLPNSLGLSNDTHTDCTLFVPSPTPSDTSTPTPINTPSPTAHVTITLTPTPSFSLTPSPTPFNPSPSFTSTPTPIPLIYISEVMVHPSTGYEWVELYNDATEPYILSNWYIDDLIDGGSPPIRFSVTIPAHGYIAIDVPSPIFNNTGDSIRLINADGHEVEIFMYDTSDIDISWGRESIYEDMLCAQTPSKGSVNNPCLSLNRASTNTPTPTPSPLTTPVSTPSNVYLSELYVNPNNGEHEWLELYNDNRYPVTLANWKIRDAADQTIASVNITLEAYRYAIVELTSDKMNNTNEEILLLYPSGDVADHFAYENSDKGASWGRSPASFSDWCLQNSSPGRYNYSCIAQPTNTPTPTPEPTRTPTPTKSKTPTPTTRVSLGNMQSTTGGSKQSGDVLGLATSRTPSDGSESLNYTPQTSETSEDAHTPNAFSQSLNDSGSADQSENILPIVLYLFLMSLCMMVGGFQSFKLWNLYHESNPVYPDMFG